MKSELKAVGYFEIRRNIALELGIIVSQSDTITLANGKGGDPEYDQFYYKDGEVQIKIKDDVGDFPAEIQRKFVEQVYNAGKNFRSRQIMKLLAPIEH